MTGREKILSPLGCMSSLKIFPSPVSKWNFCKGIVVTTCHSVGCHKQVVHQSLGKKPSVSCHIMCNVMLMLVVVDGMIVGLCPWPWGQRRRRTRGRFTGGGGDSAGPRTPTTPPPPQAASSQQIVVKGLSPRSQWAPRRPRRPRRPMGYVATLPTCGPLLILPPALKRWGPPRRQGLCSHLAHVWATSDFAPRSEALGTR